MEAPPFTPEQLPHFAAEPARAPEDWDWEAFRVGGKLYLYCYLRETVLIPLTSDAGS
jgi:hypothetical protein